MLQVESPAQELVEYKACEGYGCGFIFYRPKPANAREGERVCPGCRERELTARQQRDSAPKIDGRRKYGVARLDFLMRPAKAPPSYVPHCGLGLRSAADVSEDCRTFDVSLGGRVDGSQVSAVVAVVAMLATFAANVLGRASREGAIDEKLVSHDNRLKAHGLELDGVKERSGPAVSESPSSRPGAKSTTEVNSR